MQADLVEPSRQAYEVAYWSVAGLTVLAGGMLIVETVRIVEQWSRLSRWALHRLTPWLALTAVAALGVVLHRGDPAELEEPILTFVLAAQLLLVAVAASPSLLAQWLK